MPTKWTYPNTCTQYTDADFHVSWMNVGEDFEEVNMIRGEKEIYHIANSLSNDRKNKTYYLVCKEFDWEDLPEIITGVEVYINIRRTGRITDDTIRLYNQGPIGENMADNKIDDIKIYGSETSKWGLELTSEQFTDPEFGLVLRYQPHPSFPHSTTPYLQHVQMRVW